tara:strand:+ start:65 stop:640 length:576 start_codon:yes stop_codon:yes gene_type:complete
MTTYRVDPKFYGDNKQSNAFSTGSTVSIGEGANQWRDNTSNPADNLNCLITQSTEYSSTGANSIKLTGTGTGLCKTCFTNVSLATGREYELSFKVLIPTVPSTAEPTGYVVAIGSTAYATDLAYSGVIGIDSSNMIEGKWVQGFSLSWVSPGAGAFCTIGIVANNVGDIMFLDEVYLRQKELTYTTDADPT